MNKVLIVGALAFAAFGMAGCQENTRPDPNYVTYAQANADQAKLASSAIDSLALAAQACAGDARCVENVVAFAALAKSAASATGSRIEPYHASPSLGSQIALALVGNIAPLASAAVAWHQADTQARVSIAQTHFLDNVLTHAVDDMGNAQPNITVGGNFGQTGDNAGGNLNNIGRDYIPGTQINNTGNYGDHNRQSSPGPIGPTCTGDTCQGATNPPPAGG